MPLVDLSDPVHLGIGGDAEGAWGHPSTRPPIILQYSRSQCLDGFQPEIRRRWQWLHPLLGWDANTSVVLLGCAYGYSLEVLEEDFGMTRVIGTEPTAAIRTKMAQSEDADLDAAIVAVGLDPASGEGLQRKQLLGGPRLGLPRGRKAADVLNEDLSGNASRNRVRQAISGKGGTTWDVVTENVLTVLSDAECVTVSTRAASLAGIARLIHLVSTTLPDHNQNPVYNWKTAAEWKALLPNDTIVSLYTREIL